jgi:hypothetical protein
MAAPFNWHKAIEPYAELYLELLTAERAARLS